METTLPAILDRETIGQLLYHEYESLARFVGMQMPSWMKRVVDVEDILQETFSQAFRDAGRLEFDSHQAFSGWLKKVASNRLQDKRKWFEAKKRPSPRKTVDNNVQSSWDLLNELSGGDTTPSTIGAVSERWKQLHLALAELPTDQRKAIHQHCLEQKSLQEVAQALGRSPDAVRSLIHRGKQALREHMGNASRWFSWR